LPQAPQLEVAPTYQKGNEMISQKRRTIILGCIFISFLALAYYENTLFLGYVEHVFRYPPLAITVVFLHNVIAVSLIMIGMRLYLELVLAFPPKRDIEYAVLNHPSLFAFAFTAIILIASILKVGTFFHEQIIMSLMSMITLVFLPHGVTEAYGIYMSIHRTLTNTLTNKTLVTIYLIFFLAGILEVGFSQALLRYII